MLARKFASYRLHMAGITQNKQKCLIFIVVPQDRKNFSHIDQNEETQKYHIRTRNTKIPYHKNFKPGSLKRNFMQLPKLNLL